MLLVLAGHGDAKKVLLRLSDLPFVQLFQRKETGAPFLDSPDPFDKDLTEATVAKRLAVALYEARGDASLTVQVLLGYYKYKSQPPRSNNRYKKSSSPTPDSQTQDDVSSQELDYSGIIRKELDEATISAFESMVDREYHKAFVLKFTSCSCPRSPLVSDAEIARFYSTLKKEFPVYQFVFATAASKVGSYQQGNYWY